MTRVDVLIPTYNRVAALAVTLTSLTVQTAPDFGVFIADQTEGGGGADSAEVRAPARLLRAQGHNVGITRRRPRRGMAEQRQFLLDQVTAPYALYLDDDLILEPDVIARMVHALETAGCGFVGMAVHGLSFAGDVRPHQEAIEFWDGPVTPELVTPGSAAWERYQLHNAANLWHVQRRLNLTPATQRLYHVAWVGGCTMYDVAALRAVGGFGFWKELPPDHCGEDALAQLRVMARFGGAGHHSLRRVPYGNPDHRAGSPHECPRNPARSPPASTACRAATTCPKRRPARHARTRAHERQEAMSDTASARNRRPPIAARFRADARVQRRGVCAPCARQPVGAGFHGVGTRGRGRWLDG